MCVCKGSCAFFKLTLCYFITSFAPVCTRAGLLFWLKIPEDVGSFLVVSPPGWNLQFKVALFTLSLNICYPINKLRCIGCSLFLIQTTTRMEKKKNISISWTVAEDLLMRFVRLNGLVATGLLLLSWERRNRLFLRGWSSQITGDQEQKLVVGL